MRRIAVSIAISAAWLGSASAAPTFACARSLSSADLDTAIVTAKQAVDGFQDALGSMVIERTATSATNVGSAMMAGAMANEVAAVASGLRQMVNLRNQLSAGAGREVALMQLELAMAEAGERVSKVAESYGKVEAKSTDERTRSLAANARQFTLGLAQRWSCE